MSARIEAIEPVWVDAGFRNWIFVLVHTDDGLTGIGEATLEWQDHAVLGALQDLETMVVGEEAGRIEHLWQTMYRGAFWRGGPAWMSALSGIDQALWDIKGKVAGLPVYDLLGGRCRDRLYAYASGPDGADPGSVAAHAAQLADAGYQAMKLCPIPPTLMIDGSEGAAYAAEVLDAVRSACGPRMRLAVDLHGRTGPRSALGYARALEPFDIWFLEEPTAPDNVVGLREVARGTSISLAGGERWVSRWEFAPALELGVLALVQPDPSHCGGISEARRISAMAEIKQVGFAPHNPMSPVNTNVSAHLGLASPNFVALELVEGDAPPWRDQIARSAARFSDGWLELTPEPGLGLELDLDACRRHPGAPKPRPEFSHADGSLADW